jgi:hypothetical protein
MTDVTVQDEPIEKPDVPKKAGKDNNFSGEVAFNQDISVLMSTRLPQFDKGLVKAYAARGSDSVPVNLIALICEEQLTPRTNSITNYAIISNPSLSRLIAWGALDVQPGARQKYCLIYENNLGLPLKKDDTEGGLGMRTDIIMSAFVRPMTTVLNDLRDKEVTHGCIRLSNIYDGGKQVLERAILGEGLSVPASSNMPTLYLPAERALASSAGRGYGSHADDIYAFGVCLALLMRHDDPLMGMSDEEIIESKMENGSYLSLMGKERITGPLLELLRGLLHDDEKDRWTIDDIMHWMDGRRLTPKQAARQLKASRAIVFNSRKYFHPAILAKDLNKNAAEARQLVESGDLEQWIDRAIEDKTMQDRYARALHLAEDDGKGSGYTERLATRVAMALYPEGPIRYKSVSVMPDGIGGALTEAYVTKRDLQVYSDYILAYFITQWVDNQSRYIHDATNMIGIYDSARVYLRQKALGGGIERCIYALNPDAPCLSPKLAQYYVRSPEELMRAFEKISASPSRPQLFLDRHIIAYFAVKDRRNIDPFLSELNSELPYRRILAEMKVMATMQRRLQLERFPGIADWMLEMCDPLYSRFHDRELREDIRKKAERLKEGGDLVKIVALFDTQSTYQEDNVGFRRAMRKYTELEKESSDLERDLRDEAKFGRGFGQQVSAFVSGILSALILLAVALSTFGKTETFF